MGDLEYRAVLKFRTSGNSLLKIRSDWVQYKDQLDEVVESIKPIKAERGQFVGYDIESKQVIDYEVKV